MDDNDNVVRLIPDVVGSDYYIEPDQILVEALGQYANIVIVGETEDGEIHVSGSSNMGEANLLLDVGKKHLLDNL